MLYGTQSEEARQREFFMMVGHLAGHHQGPELHDPAKKYEHSTGTTPTRFGPRRTARSSLLPTAKPSGLAMEKLADFDKVIRGNATDAEKAIAIAWLEHLIGDIHQPLHASARVTDSKAKRRSGRQSFSADAEGHAAKSRRIFIRSGTRSSCDVLAEHQGPVRGRLSLDPIGDEIMKLYPYDSQGRAR